jgi:excisionase family DNA binding protein
VSALAAEIREAVQQALREELPHLVAELRAMVAGGGDALVDVDGAARRLGLARSTVYKLAQRCELSSVPMGRSLRFRPADLDAYVEARRRSPELVKKIAADAARP